MSALAVAGMFALVLVVARTPQLAALPMFANLFHEALVVHVDLSVLVWFLAVACMYLSMYAANGSKRAPFEVPLLEQAALCAFSLGAVGIAVSPFAAGEPLMSNYIPVISNVPFFLGLALLFVGVTLQLIHALMRRPLPADNSIVAFVTCYGSWSAAWITLFALAAFVLSYIGMPAVLEGQQYYEILFWGGGHVLQFTHTQILLVVWVMLAYALYPHCMLNRKWLGILLGVGLIAAVTAPLAYALHEVSAFEFRQFFTHHMIALGGIAPMLLIVMLLPWLLRKPHNYGQVRALHSTLLASVVLFVYGGALGTMISGQNVTIPAHYHGSIVGVTLAFMGAAYLAMPRFGYASVAQSRLAFWQPIVYGGGQILHITGLAWSGGYGVLRKDPGALQAGFTSAKAAMGIMGLGGMLAIIGGFMFVIVIARGLRAKA